MRQLSITPCITVTIGRHTRQYFAFVTTAPPELDSPATVRLHEGSFSDVVGLCRRPSHVQRAPCPHTSTPGAHRGTGTRLAASQVPRTSAPVPARGSWPRRPQHAAALALAAPPGACRQPGGRMTPSTHSLASTARPNGELFRRARYGRQNHAERQRQPARQTRGCRAAFHRRRARRLEADRLL